MLIQKIKNMKYIQLFEIPIICFLCFVLLESSGGNAETLNAFIFSLNNFGRLAPFVSKVKPEHKGQAIQRSSFYGPKFGQDLIIYLDTGNIQHSKAILGMVYADPPAKQDPPTVLAGTENFSLDKVEVEVFYLDPSR